MTREEAIEIIKNRFDKWALDDKDLEAIQTLIPELAESEDERVINELQAFLASYGADYFGTGRWQKFEDWLEKQKEQKPAEWSEEDEKMRQHIVSDLREFRDCETDEGLISDYENEIAWLKSLRPSWKPSEEQMEALEIASTNKYLSAKQFDILVSLYEQLKKL